uniref:Calphotin-like protein n=1 Tax=Oryza sativa subsp. japonica TaxID=39947 RepID=Q6H402_ORYSJ|nr:calphotin-like protein [Oryza sativa Japonica Group]
MVVEDFPYEAMMMEDVVISTEDGPQLMLRLLFAGLPSVSREDLRKCIPAGNSGVAATVPPPAASAASPVRRPTSPPPLPAPERHPLPRPSHGVARISSERRRPRRLSLGLVGTHSGSPFRRASAPADVAISTSGIAAASGVFRAVLVSVQPLPVIVFVLGSASSSLVPAASRLRPRIAAEVVPSPFVSVVPGRLRRARSSLSFPRLVAWW